MLQHDEINSDDTRKKYHLNNKYDIVKAGHYYVNCSGLNQYKIMKNTFDGFGQER